MPIRHDTCCARLDHLTDREVDVLVGLAAGGTSAKIAAELGFSEHTITKHVAKLERTFRAANRVELVAKAYAYGILAQPTWPPGPTGRRCLPVDL